MQDVASKDAPQQQVGLWLFNDLLLCASSTTNSKTGNPEYRLVFQIPLQLVRWHSQGQGDETAMVVMEDPSGAGAAVPLSVAAMRMERRASVSMPSPPGFIRNRGSAVDKAEPKEYRLVCTSAKQKTTWIQEILSAQQKQRTEAVQTRTLVTKDLLPAMAESDWELVFKDSKPLLIKAGTVLLKDGTPNAKLLRVVSGQVSLRKNTRAGAVVELLTLNAGEVFMARRHHSVTLIITLANTTHHLQVFGINALLGAEHEELVYDAVALDDSTRVQSVGFPALLLELAKDDLLKRRLYKSAATLQESILRSARLRYAASLKSEQKKVAPPSANELFRLALQVVEEAEQSVGARGGHTKLDLADVLLGTAPESLAEVLPALHELRSYGCAAQLGLTRIQWSDILTALEQDKVFGQAKDGTPLLLKKGARFFPVAFAFRALSPPPPPSMTSIRQV